MNIIEIDDYTYFIDIEWKPIIFRGKMTNYEVSNIGEIRNSTTKKLLTQSKDRDGYMHASISVDGKLYHPGVHRYVAEAFIPNPENKPQVNHINGIKSINIVDNLEWVTAKENIEHAFKVGLKNSIKGEENSLSVYSEKQIRKVCKLLEQNISNKKISKLTGVDRKYITDIKKGRRWKHVSREYNIKQSVITKKDRSKIIDLARQGLSVSQICSELNLNEQKVAYRVYRIISSYLISTHQLQESPSTTSPMDVHQEANAWPGNE